MTDKTRRTQAQKIWNYFKTQVDPGYRSPCIEMDQSVLKRLEEELEKAELRGSRRSRNSIFDRFYPNAKAPKGTKS